MTSQPPNGTTPPGNGDNGSDGGNAAGHQLTHGPIQLSAGTVLIGTYEIVAHINTGGMGEIYRGRNIHNDEPVAIKIVLPALAHDQKILSLFQKESTVLRRVAHDAIVRYEVFTIDPGIGRPCLVMEYVEGVALSDHTEGRPLPEQEVLSLVVRLADGLQVAHRAGVVHRDLSPDNVILRDGNVDTSKIIDFGIAKETTSGGGTLIGGQFAGKPGYVAPEQLGLYDAHVTEQADVYSLGLLAAAAALGRPLDMGDSPADAVRARMDVPDLSALPERLRGLLGWMLQPDPGQRPAGMPGVIAAVGQMSHPPQMPPQRSQGPQPMSVPPASTPAGTSPPASVPPGTAAPATSAAPVSELRVSEEGASPFGPPPAATATPAEAAPAPPEQKRRGGVTRVLAILVLLGSLGVGGAWYAGVLPVESLSQIAVPDTPDPPQPDPAAQRDWLEARFDTYTGDCRHLQPAASVPAGTEGLPIQGFALQNAAFDGLRADFAAALGTDPALAVTSVPEAQCATLDFVAGAAQPFAAGTAPSVLPAQDSLPVDAALEGRLSGIDEGAVALLLIGPTGRLQNVTGEMGADGVFSLPPRRLRVPQAADLGADAPFLLLALRSAMPLDTVSLIPENAVLPADQVGEFWRFLGQDIARQGEESEGSEVRATLSAVRLGR
ncbi:serine/threonine-protein kinase [Salibaculum sp.]|uniref:serine/threonine-protein kinase n=1 Tax=Salibaculum sp. TaxID=2855480 RepID=UPI002B480DB1|nr:serine/threonine-protein kinase [Salibaculum sp.]HKL69587.1 serine/threonine-protein kinase [Salibaculum sp.]